jgi:hypothetical protein
VLGAALAELARLAVSRFELWHAALAAMETMTLTRIAALRSRCMAFGSVPATHATHQASRGNAAAISALGT